MLDHVSITVSDIAAAERFYNSMINELVVCRPTYNAVFDDF